jgi:hypothetical protein
VGSGYLSYKRPFGELLNIAMRVYPEEYDYFCPKTYFFPEDKDIVE